MSSSPVPKSSDEPPQNASSVFDFLYNDSERVASFLGQFDPSGHLTGFKKLLNAGEATTSSSDISGTGNVGVLKGGMKATNSTLEDHRRGSESTFDPLWSNALAFLDHLEANKLIEREIWNARIGQFVLLKGYLTVLDVSMLKAAWKLPSVQAAIKSGTEPTSQSQGNRQQRRANGGHKQPSPPNETDLALELIGIMPHLVQARLLGERFYAWGSLKEEGLVTSAGDLLLKHGMRIGGEWAMLGILDAFPDVGIKDAPESDPSMGVASLMLSHLGPAARLILGRPDIAHGVTPLLIFREVNAGPSPDTEQHVSPHPAS